jgi:hypothetical protein
VHAMAEQATNPPRERNREALGVQPRAGVSPERRQHPLCICDACSPWPAPTRAAGSRLTLHPEPEPAPLAPVPHPESKSQTPDRESNQRSCIHMHIYSAQRHRSVALPGWGAGRGGGVQALYRGTSLIRSSASLGPYSTTMPRASW